MPIYDILGVVVIAFPLATNPSNIQSGFRVSGINSFNRDVFEESVFAPSFIIDCPLELQQPLAHLTTTVVQQLLTGFTTIQV